MLDTLAGERVDRLGCGQPRGSRHHQIRSDACGYFQNLCALVDSDSVDAEVDLVTRTHHAQEPRGPADEPGRRTILTIGGGQRVLRGGRQPHAVHDGRFQPGQQRGRPVGVDRVVVAGHLRERAHVDRGGELDIATAAPRRVGRVLGHCATGPGRVAEFGGTGTSEDRESLREGGDDGPVRTGHRHRDRDDTAHVGVGRRRSRCGDRQLGLFGW